MTPIILLVTVAINTEGHPSTEILANMGSYSISNVRQKPSSCVRLLLKRARPGESAALRRETFESDPKPFSTSPKSFISTCRSVEVHSRPGLWLTLKHGSPPGLLGAHWTLLRGLPAPPASPPLPLPLPFSKWKTHGSGRKNSSGWTFPGYLALQSIPRRRQ